MGSNGHIDKAKAFKTAQTLAHGYHDFLGHFKLYAGWFRLDRVVLLNLVERYWLDVDRLHRYHATTRIDRHKIAGYLTYWICRMRPIAVVSNRANLEHADIALHVNELFAVFVALSRLDVHHRIEKNGQTVFIKKGFFNALMYNLRYRPFTGDTMAMLYYMLEGKERGYDGQTETDLKT